MRAALFCLLLGFSASATSAQPISTDRPDFGVGTAIVPLNALQVESGLKRSEQGAVKHDQFFESLVRFGIADPLEVRMSWSGLNRISEGGPSAAGDLGFGLKARVSQGSGLLPGAAVLGSLSLPSGGHGVSAGVSVPEFRLALSWLVAERLGLTLNGGSFWVREEPSSGAATRHRTDLFSATLGLAYGSGTVYAEAYGLRPQQADRSAQYSAGLGYLYLIRESLQFDVYAGSGLNDSAGELFAGAGLSIVFPR